MATTLFLRSTNWWTGNSATENYLTTHTARSSNVFTDVADTVGSSTQERFRESSGSSVLKGQWISRELTAGVTLSGAVTFNGWFLESNMSANVGARTRLFKRSPDGTEVEMGGGPFDDGAEFGTSAAVFNWTGTPTSNNVLAVGDRIVVRFYITAVGTMAGGHTATMDYAGATAAADGDSFITTTETLTLNADDFWQDGARFRNDDGSEAAATWIAAINADIERTTAQLDSNIRLRVEHGNMNAADARPRYRQLQYRKNAGSWLNVNSTSSVARSSVSANFADGDATTVQLAANFLSFVAGSMDEADGLANSTASLSQGVATEHEYCFQLRSADLVATDTVEFRLVLDSATATECQEVRAYPKITITAPPPVTPPPPTIINQAVARAANW